MAAANRGQTTGEPIWTATRVPLDECEADDNTLNDARTDDTAADDDTADDTTADDESSHDTPILTRTRAP